MRATSDSKSFWPRHAMSDVWANVTVHFITYADAAYRSSAHLLMTRMCPPQHHAIIHDCRLYNETDAQRLASNSPHTARLIASKVGRHAAGFWLWKPLIIHEKLSQLRDDEVLIYADAGCSVSLAAFSDHRDYWRRLSSLFNSRPVDASNLVMRWAGFCRQGVAREMLGGDEKAVGRFMQEPQVEANRLMIRKTGATVALIGEWASLALKRPELFADAESADVEPHRHDQAVFDLLLIKHGWPLRGFVGAFSWIVATRTRVPKDSNHTTASRALIDVR